MKFEIECDIDILRFQVTKLKTNFGRIDFLVLA